MLSAGASQALSDAEFTDFVRTECGKGHVERCWLYGGQLERGKGTHQNYTEAVKVYDHACEQGLGEACHALAILVLDGKSVEQNVTKAIELYTRKGIATSRFISVRQALSESIPRRHG